ncbi:MAG: FAD-dependent monooxygenase [Gammaproteobacteria bacterium]
MDARLICVVGGGISGLAFAALHEKNGGKTLVLERQNPAEGEDGKSVVVNSAAVKILQDAGAQADGAPLETVRVNFQNAPGGMTIRGGVLGRGIAHRAVHQQLAAGLGGSFCAPAKVISISQNKNAAQIIYQTENGVQETEAAAALVACELPQTPPPFAARALDCRQTIISFSAQARNFPHASAVECFTQDGIAAIVPRADAKIGIILCAADAAAGRLSALEDDALMRRLNDIFGGEFGIHSPSPRYIYAPRIRHVSPLADGKIALLGAGATMLHPAGAQGLNMGLADAKTLAAFLANGENIENALAKYARRRAPAHLRLLAATGMLAAGGHLRQLPFRLLGGMAAAALSAAAFPRQKKFAEFLAGEK